MRGIIARAINRVSDMISACLESGNSTSGARRRADLIHSIGAPSSRGHSLPVFCLDLQPAGGASRFIAPSYLGRPHKKHNNMRIPSIDIGNHAAKAAAILSFLPSYRELGTHESTDIMARAKQTSTDTYKTPRMFLNSCLGQRCAHPRR
jgi:hypothetical protein